MRYSGYSMAGPPPPGNSLLIVCFGDAKRGQLGVEPVSGARCKAVQNSAKMGPCWCCFMLFPFKVEHKQRTRELLCIACAVRCRQADKSQHDSDSGGQSKASSHAKRVMWRSHKASLVSRWKQGFKIARFLILSPFLHFSIFSSFNFWSVWVQLGSKNLQELRHQEVVQIEAAGVASFVVGSRGQAPGVISARSETLNFPLNSIKGHTTWMKFLFYAYTNINEKLSAKGLVRLCFQSRKPKRTFFFRFVFQVWAFGSNRSMELGGRKEVAQIASAQRMKSVRDVHVVQAGEKRLENQKCLEKVSAIWKSRLKFHLWKSPCISCISLKGRRKIPTALLKVSSANSTSGQTHTLVLGANGEVLKPVIKHFEANRKIAGNRKPRKLTNGKEM